jgi:filamentous hemagglutinin
MVGGKFDFKSKEGRIGGYIDKKGVYHVGEGHHRMAAAIEIYKKTGDASYIKELIKNGSWTKTESAPNNSRPMPSRSAWGRFRNWLGI